MGGSSFTAKTSTTHHLSHNPIIQRAVLILLVLQNSTLILTLRHSRVAVSESGDRYLASTAVLLVEVVKLLASLVLATHELARDQPSSSRAELSALVFRTVFSRGSMRLVLPAALYTLQNSLVYVAITNLEAVTFQVTYQLKILTTVLFSMAMLGRTISSRQWLALTLLVVGVVIVQISGPLSQGLFSFSELKNRIFSAVLSAPLTGLLAVLAASIISGFTCVYFEKLVKDSLKSVSLWTRNAQLAFFSIFPALFIGVIWQDGEEIARDGFFKGYTALVWVTIALQASGGIIVALCITYADNVAKNFATSLSIAVSGMASMVLFRTPVTAPATVGTSIVLIATYIYQTSLRTAPATILPLRRDIGKSMKKFSSRYDYGYLKPES